MERIIKKILILFIISQIIFVINPEAKKISKSKQLTELIIVDKNGKGDYFTINEALTYANPASTIYIKKGEYSEILEINQPIFLKGEGRDCTLINPISKKNKYAIRLGGAGASIEGLSINNKAPGLYANAIRITGNNNKIENCNIYSTPVGIAIWSSNNLIKNCTFWNCQDEGIALLGSKYTQCNNNKITYCIFYDNCDGIELQYSSENQIMHCSFYNNTHSGIDAIAQDNNYNIISNCKIYNNRVNGIYLSSSKNNQIIDCEIFNNQDGDIISNKQSKNNEIVTTNTFALDIKTLLIDRIKTRENIFLRILDKIF